MTFVVPIDVRFRDLDPLGHVNSAAYMTFMEHARVRFFLEQGLAQSESGLPFILAAATVAYLAPMTMASVAEVALRTSRVGTKSWEFEYEVRSRARETTYARGKTVQVAYEYGARRTVPIPAAVRAALERIG